MFKREKRISSFDIENSRIVQTIFGDCPTEIIFDLFKKEKDRSAARFVTAELY